MTTWQLLSLLMQRDTPYFTHNGQRYILLGISREGGHNCFIVNAYDNDNNKVNLFIRTTG